MLSAWRNGGPLPKAGWRFEPSGIRHHQRQPSRLAHSWGGRDWYVPPFRWCTTIHTCPRRIIDIAIEGWPGPTHSWRRHQFSLPGRRRRGSSRWHRERAGLRAHISAMMAVGLLVPLVLRGFGGRHLAVASRSPTRWLTGLAPGRRARAWQGRHLPCGMPKEQDTHVDGSRWVRICWKVVGVAGSCLRRTTLGVPS